MGYQTSDTLRRSLYTGGWVTCGTFSLEVCNVTNFSHRVRTGPGKP